MLLSEFTYPLTDQNIAYFPPTIRGESNLLVINTDGLDETNFKTKLTIDKYKNLYKYLENGDQVVLNNTKVIPARILGKNIRGANIEILLLENHNDKKFQVNAIIRGNIKEWEDLYIGKKKILKITEKVGEFGKVRILMKWEKLSELAQMPLPPYIERENVLEDRTRYQTVMAKVEGSVAAPTASLNITPELLENFKKSNIDYDYLTLHCGYGTFNAIKAEVIEEHEMHSEYFEIPNSLWEKINSSNKKIVAVGTTVTRTLEYLHSNPQMVNETNIKGEADIFLFPGKHFHIVDKLVTNFHAPNSTPLMLTIAFFIHKLSTTGITETEIHRYKKIFFEIYQFALDNNFKFLSYGDSMLII